MRSLLTGSAIFLVSIVGLVLLQMAMSFGSQKAYGLGYFRAQAPTLWVVGLLYIALGIGLWRLPNIVLH